MALKSRRLSSHRPAPTIPRGGRRTGEMAVTMGFGKWADYICNMSGGWDEFVAHAGLSLIHLQVYLLFMPHKAEANPKAR